MIDLPDRGAGVAHLPAQFVKPPSANPISISSIQYGVLSANEIHRLSVLPCRRVIGPVREFGVNDNRLGVCDRASVCTTCGQRSVDCVGHVGHIDLEAPVFHLGFFTAVLRICRTICKSCAHVLLTEEERAYYCHRLRGKMETQQRLALLKQVQEDAYKSRVCQHCGGLNGVVRRARPMRIIHEKYRVDLRRGEEALEDVDNFFNVELRSALNHNKELANYVSHTHDFLDPARVRQLFLAIPLEDLLLLGMQPGAHPAHLLMNTLLVPPVPVRPRGMTANQAREDDLTTQYNDILISSDALRDGTNDVVKYIESWDLLQTRTARLLDSAMPSFPAHLRTADMKSYAQRMKGKHGRFRGNLSGKRVDFSGRSVISPDPNLAIDELAVPLRVARVLTYPQRVFSHNIELMRRLVRNGPQVHPGAITVYLAAEGSRKSLFSARDRQALATRLSVGDIVERHVMNGDMILFNRQPSLHRISMMAHRARVLPYRTFRFNECCCAPYNADFDGDEMNVHVVQTEEARAEAHELMLTAKNIITAKNGEPIIACTQDFLTAAYLVTARDAFFDRSQFTFLVSHWLGPHTRYELPIPALLKPVELWTGKQLFELILRPSANNDVLLTLEAKARFYSGTGRHNDVAEGFVSFLDSKFIAGRLDKKILGGGAKDGLFARLHALTGGPYTATCMARIAQFTSRYLQNYGFSFGLEDVAPTPSLNAKTAAVLTRSFAKCDALIKLAATGRLTPMPGMTVKQSLEARLNSELSKVRDECGSAAIDTLDVAYNVPLIMVNSGSKGSALNTAQMMACVGQQTVSGKRIVNAFQDRSLPHFPRFAEDPAARGFVANSFFSGLTPTEFFFHTMAGREGLVDTAVKTAETGYIYRRLSKAMENLSVKYDTTVRNAKNEVVQLRYGEDGLDPWLMEGSGGTPLNLEQEWLANRASYARGWQQRARDRERLRECPVADRGEALIPDAQYRKWHVLSLLPGEVVPFAEKCLDGAEDVLQECALRERLEQIESTAARLLPVSADAPDDDGDPRVEGSSRRGEAYVKDNEAALPVRALYRLAQLRSARFRDDVCAFFAKKVMEQVRLRELLELPLHRHEEATSRYSAKPAGGEQPTQQQLMERKRSEDDVATAGTLGDAGSSSSTPYFIESLQTELLPLTEGMLCLFLEECARKYLRKACEPGTPCGAIAAQSVGEPSTQMTLRTFHFAGVASMSITQGVPRLVEIINANKNIATPVITAPIVLDGGSGVLPQATAQAAGMKPQQRLHRTARAVKGLVERVLLKEVAREVVEVVTRERYFLQIFLNMPLIERLLLPVNAIVVRQRILAAAAKPMSALRLLRPDCVEVVSQDSLIVYPYERDADKVHFSVQFLLKLLPELVVCGLPGVNRVMIAKDGAELLAEGAELRSVMALPYVDGTRTVCNHVAVVERTLGIEAARQTIVNEICSILKAYSLSIDVRHIYLLADIMTNRGVVLGITRYGIQKMNNNVLTMASFERTTEHLYNAAVTQRTDTDLSVSESIIIGKPVPLGTSAFSLLLSKGSQNPEKMTGSLRRPAVGTTAPQGDPTISEALWRLSKRGASRGHRTRPSLAAEGAFRVDLFT